jgi:hypothetical protein
VVARRVVGRVAAVEADSKGACYGHGPGSGHGRRYSSVNRVPHSAQVMTSRSRATRGQR